MLNLVTHQIQTLEKVIIYDFSLKNLFLSHVILSHSCLLTVRSQSSPAFMDSLYVPNHNSYTEVCDFIMIAMIMQLQGGSLLKTSFHCHLC